jgi:hypothetical protein
VAGRKINDKISLAKAGYYQRNHKIIALADIMGRPFCGEDAGRQRGRKP